LSPSPIYPQPPQQPQRSGLLTALVAGAVIALVAANIYLYVQIDHVRTDVAKVREDLMNQVEQPARRIDRERVDPQGPIWTR